ncbi:sodium-dependent nutrient amino acid transporter 1-like isoform X2 [Palaemon carinicauda]|uniref:sodium-dependent nutrient amino acid transporter 1-like isoform X2 n=1 Tax=Palaemon carinicauda TaxID=392227 RepID=UPI0035B66266
MSVWPVIASSKSDKSPLSPQWVLPNPSKTGVAEELDGEKFYIAEIKKGNHGSPGCYQGDENFGDSQTELIPETILDLPDEDGEERQEWSNPVEFLLSCIALSVGLGNVWRFPMTAYENGGGAFLIPYLIVLTFIGRPLYFLELAVGQFSSLGSVKVWKCVPAVKGVGIGQLVGNWSVVTYYCSLMALCVFYFIQSFSSVLPWSVCDYENWADENCVDASGNMTFTNTSQSSSEQYYIKYVLKQSDSIMDGIGLPEWRLSLCLLFSWVILFLTLAKGVQSSGKVAYFTALFPYVVLFTLLGRGATLPGAVDGVIYFITPQWEKLADPSVWYAAVTQSFFSLSVGFGAIITFGSYNNFKQNVYRDAWIISLADTLTSLLAGFTIFCILGNLAHELDTDIKRVVRGGSGLAFISYPDALAKFDYAPQVFAVLFFLMMFTLGVGSAAALTNNVITVFCDQFPKVKKIYITFGICLVSFLIGLVYVTPGGPWIVDLVDYFGGGFIIFVLVIIETVSIMCIYGMRNLLRDIKFMIGVDLGIYWKFCWAFFIPVSLTAILLYILIDLRLPTFNGIAYPTVAYAAGWALAGIAVGFVPLAFIHAVYIGEGSSLIKKLVGVFRPKPTWGPAKNKYRKEWEKIKNSD